jgi:hypothetical protein
LNQQKQITVIGLIAIASIIVASPFVYAAVEPHIILVMDSAQTTQPFTIQNNTGFDMFVIDSNGDISKESGNTYLIRALSGDITTVLTTHTFADPLVLAAVKFTPKTQNSGGTGFPYHEVRFSGEMDRESGTSQIQIIAAYSEDDSSWQQYGFCTTTSDTWGGACTLIHDAYNTGDPDIYFRIVAINGDGATSGQIANYDLQMRLMVPPGWEVDPAWTG